MTEVDVKRVLLEIAEDNRAVALLVIDEKTFVRRLRVEDVTQYPVKPQVEVPMVYCPKEKKRVHIFSCLGSYTLGITACPELVEATVNLKKGVATVKCKAQEEEKKWRIGPRRLS